MTWSDGRLVLKPAGGAAEHDWVCDVYDAWSAHDVVRVPSPVRPHLSTAARVGDSDPRWSYEGWGAHAYLPGRSTELPAEAERVREASGPFHAAVAALARPAFLDDRTDPWSYGDRMAWDDAEPVGDQSTVDLVDELRAAFAPVRSPDQMIHGDLLPNVLVADGLPPAVIDWPPYHRPAAWADAITVTDLVTFRGAPLTELDRWGSGDDWRQLLIRAIVYRLGPTGIFAKHHRLRGSLVRHVELARPVVAAVLDG